MTDEYKVVRVTMEHDFLIPSYWFNSPDYKEIMKEEWFGKFLNSFHATRDSFEVGNGKKFLKMIELSLDEFQKEREAEKKKNDTMDSEEIQNED